MKGLRNLKPERKLTTVLHWPLCRGRPFCLPATTQGQPWARGNMRSPQVTGKLLPQAVQHKLEPQNRSYFVSAMSQCCPHWGAVMEPLGKVMEHRRTGCPLQKVSGEGAICPVPTDTPAYLLLSRLGLHLQSHFCPMSVLTSRWPCEPPSEFHCPCEAGLQPSPHAPQLQVHLPQPGCT